MFETDAREFAVYLEDLADTHDKMAEESEYGGWSTHQVGQNRSIANDLRRKASELRRTYNLGRKL